MAPPRHAHHGVARSTSSILALQRNTEILRHLFMGILLRTAWKLNIFKKLVLKKVQVIVGDLFGPLWTFPRNIRNKTYSRPYRENKNLNGTLCLAECSLGPRAESTRRPRGHWLCQILRTVTIARSQRPWQCSAVQGDERLGNHNSTDAHSFIDCFIDCFFSFWRIRRIEWSTSTELMNKKCAIRCKVDEQLTQD